MDVVTLGQFTLGRGVFEPGWRCSNDVKPIAGTDSCQVHHTGLCPSGQMTIKPDDGEEVTIGPGDVIDLDPGHDAWTVGDEACVLVDIVVAAYAQPADTNHSLKGSTAGPRCVTSPRDGLSVNGLVRIRRAYFAMLTSSVSGRWQWTRAPWCRTSRPAGRQSARGGPRWGP